jgi:hypothetical protein
VVRDGQWICSLGAAILYQVQDWEEGEVALAYGQIYKKQTSPLLPPSRAFAASLSASGCRGPWPHPSLSETKTYQALWKLGVT